jgi:cytosine/adenosine deaminase-related metal-dependent hydrolase
MLRTLTTAPAARFERGRRSGRVAPGYAADLVLLDGDPDERVEALAAVRCTIRDGRIVYGGPACASVEPQRGDRVGIELPQHVEEARAQR